MSTKKTDKDGTDITSSTPVTLGETVWIGVTSTDAALGTNFYLSDCTATNGAAATKSIQLVDGGCMSKLAGTLNTDIAAATGEEGDYQFLEFNQFAFADSSQSKI